MTALKDALDALRPFAEVSLLAAYQSLPEGQYFDLHFADGDEACFNAFTVADLRRAAAVYAAIEKMKGDADHKCFECGADLTVVCLRCNPLAEAPPPPVPRERSIDDLLAGNAFRDTLIPRADAFNGPSPMFFGWAIMDAFLAGLDHARAEIAATAPLPAQEVTDAMVEQALVILNDQFGGANRWTAVRTALESALRPGKD